jgi:putative Mg2+ transporter-C (MgtC) family protein
MHLRRPDSRNIEDSVRIEIEATIHADTRSDRSIEQIVGRLSLEPSVTAARWRVETLSE